MFGLFKKEKEQEVNRNIVAVANGQLVDISKVNDPVFAEKMMGDGIAILTEEDTVTVYSPADGDLEAVFPTGHAFGIKTTEGVDILVHIGINTVESSGEGFSVLGKKQGDKVKAGEPIVKVDMKNLRGKYDMPIMVIITEANGKEISFIAEQSVKVGDSIRA